jgi:hypothetical protein
MAGPAQNNHWIFGGEWRVGCATGDQDSRAVLEALLPDDGGDTDGSGVLTGRVRNPQGAEFVVSIRLTLSS